MQKRSQTSRPRTGRRRRGFTLVELLITLAIAMIVLSIGLPELRKMILRSKMETFARETRLVLQRTRMMSIKRGFDTVVSVDAANVRLFTYVDLPEVDAVTGLRTDVPWAYAPNYGDPPEIRDERIVQSEIPSQIEQVAPGTQNVVDGLTALPSGEKVAVFQSDGSVRDIGGFRFADGRSNYLEVRVPVAATGLVQLRKWDCDLNKWIEQRENWIWYYSPQPGC